MAKKQSAAVKAGSESPRRLLPAQQRAADMLHRGVEANGVAVLMGRPGAGKSTILRELHARLGGTFVTSGDFVDATSRHHPLALEEAVFEMLQGALKSSHAVVVDDFQFVAFISCCSHFYPRQNYLAAATVAISAIARTSGKKLVFATEGTHIPGLHGTAVTAHIPEFTEEDYRALCSEYLNESAAQTLDIRKVFRFAPKLNARQIRGTCEALRDDEVVDTDRFIEYLREHHMASNVDIAEVQAVDLKDLKGLDDVLEALEANVILPLEDSKLAEDLDLQAKRGVLLAGPPGTGKTTIGRALARRLKSKFFLIDGTVVSGSPEFYHRIHHVFEAAKQNAPAIIFIDDSDVIFESGQDTGLYRYLLTMLDGLESASAGRVCLMMTAMDVGNLPPALVRSGRIELWLETRLPTVEARAAILADRTKALPAAVGTLDVQRLADESEGLSGADLKRVIEDGKLLFAYEFARQSSSLPATEYFLRAIETVRRNKQQYAEAEARARMRHPVRPPYFDAFPMASFIEGHATMAQSAVFLGETSP